jgi:signal transduction histidine kinase
VEIKFTDTGYGIPEEVRPYFLKKRVPKDINKAGMGMGLLIAKFVLRKYGGNLRLLWSEEGKGTALSILLSVAPENNEYISRKVKWATRGIS